MIRPILEAEAAELAGARFEERQDGMDVVVAFDAVAGIVFAQRIRPELIALLGARAEPRDLSAPPGPPVEP